MMKRLFYRVVGVLLVAVVWVVSVLLTPLVALSIRSIGWAKWLEKRANQCVE